MIKQLRTSGAITSTNIASHLLYEVEEDTFYLASLWACYAQDVTADPEEAFIYICVVPPSVTPTGFSEDNATSLRAHAIAWGQQIYGHESFNVAGMALPKETKIYTGATVKNMVFTLTGSGM